jgi:hypothetical protein
MNIALYWSEVKKVEAALPAGDTFWVTSVDNAVYNSRPGAPSEASRRVAAELIAKQTHRLATPDEIRAHQAQRAADGNALTKSENEKKMQTVVHITADQIQTAQPSKQKPQ